MVKDFHMMYCQCMIYFNNLLPRLHRRVFVEDFKIVQMPEDFVSFVVLSVLHREEVFGAEM